MVYKENIYLKHQIKNKKKHNSRECSNTELYDIVIEKKKLFYLLEMTVVIIKSLIETHLIVFIKCSVLRQSFMSKPFNYILLIHYRANACNVVVKSYIIEKSQTHSERILLWDKNKKSWTVHIFTFHNGFWNLFYTYNCDRAIIRLLWTVYSINQSPYSRSELRPLIRSRLLRANKCFCPRSCRRNMTFSRVILEKNRFK